MRRFTVIKCWGRLLLPALVFICAFAEAADLEAQGRVVAQEPVDIVIQSAHLLSLRVGSGGRTIDVVRFEVTGLPGSGPVPGVASGQNPVPVRARAVQLTGQMILTVDSSVPLDDGSGNIIPFPEIAWTGTGIIPTDTFAGAPNQLLFATTSSKAQGTMAFYYRNILYVPAGSYIGRVTYTLSSP